MLITQTNEIEHTKKMLAYCRGQTSTAYAFNGTRIVSICCVCECVCCRINNTVTHRNKRKKIIEVNVYLCIHRNPQFKLLIFMSCGLHLVLGVERKPLRIIVLVKPYAMTEYFFFFFNAADQQRYT